MHLDQEMHEHVAWHQEKFLETHEHFYKFRLITALQALNAIEAFKARDRQKLYDTLIGHWNVWKEENPYLEIMHFHLPDGNSFLRMHKPEVYGDNIAQKRPMVAAMHKQQEPLYGFEAGLHMMAYRFFLPIFDKDSYIGAVEIGMRPDQMLKDIIYYTDTQGAFFIKQEKILKYKEKTGFVRNGFELQYTSLDDPSLIQQLPNNYTFGDDLSLNINERLYTVYTLNIKDYADNVVGKTLFFNDITEVTNNFNNTVKRMLFFLLTLLLFTILAVWVGFEKILKRLQKAHAALEHNRLYLRSVLDNSAYAVITTDLSGTITLFNKAAEKMLGYRANEMIGKHSPALFHKMDEVTQQAQTLSTRFNKRIEPGFQVFIEKTLQGIPNEDNWTYISADGKEFPVHLKITALRNKKGATEGYLGIAEDISTQVESRQALIDAKKRLDEAQNIAKIGSWNLDLTNNHLIWSDEIYNIFEIDPKGFEPSYEGFLNAIHPDDVEIVNKAFTDSLANHTPYSIEHRLLMRDGRIKYVHERGYTTYNEDGEAILSQGTIQDITIRKSNQLREEHYLNMLDEHVITSSTDLDGNIIQVSKAFCDISGYSKEELIGSNHRIVRYSDIEPQTYQDLWNTILDNKTWEGELKNRTKDGAFYWVKTTISPDFNEKGDKIGYTAIHQDITNRKMVEALAITDKLTGLYNRLKLDEVFSYEIRQSERYGNRLSIIILDIDKFKNVNDTFGHQTGDVVLQQLSRLIAENVRTADTVGRWGGEEFLIICPNVDVDKAGILAEKLRQVIEGYRFPKVGQKSCSFGVTEFIKGDSEEKMVERADKALYKAKRDGRNQVVIL